MAAATVQTTTLQRTVQSKLQVDRQKVLRGSSKPVWHEFNASTGFWHPAHKPFGRGKFLPPGLMIAESVSMLETRQKYLAVQAGSKGGLKSKALWEMQNPKRISTDVCPCGGGMEKDRYQTCCARFHKKGLIPTTALLLMRSRYTAYVKGLVDYLVETTHPDHPDYDTMRKSVRDTVNRVRFKKLAIQDFANGENEAFVTFRFDFSLGRGVDRHITERSRFVKEDGRWLFIGTEILEPENPDDEDNPLAPLSNLDV